MQLDLSDESAYEVGDNDKNEIEEDYIQTNISDNSSKRNLTKLPTLASVCDRYGVPNYAGAAIASSTLVDYAIITKVVKSQVIGLQKLGNERRRCREERREAELGKLKELTSLYFDGKKTMTLTNQPLYVASCDSCRVNTRPNGGVIYHLEMLLARPLHYSICQLYGNELPFRAIFYYYDGKPSGPENKRGMIGQQIKEPVSDLPFIDF